MAGFFATPLRRGSVLAIALFLGACGMEPAQSSIQSSIGKDNSQASSLKLARLNREENRLLADPLCVEADEEYRPMIALILKAHNKAVAEISDATSQNLLKAGSPDYPGGISLRVCDDQNVYAYSYSKTVILHSGLLETLSYEAGGGDLFASSVAFVIYHELGHIQMGHARRMANIGEVNAVVNPFDEIEADMFAAKILQRAGYSLKGVDIVFSVLNRINPDGSAGHPSPWQRAEMVHQVKAGERYDTDFATP